MNYKSLNKYFNERNLLILSVITTVIFLFLNIVGILRLPSFLSGIVVALFPYKICFLVLSFVFIIFSFINIVEDTNDKIKISVSSSILQILFKIFTILFWTGFICIPTRYYDMKIYMLQNTILIVTLVFLSILIYLSLKNTSTGYVCSNCAAKVSENQKFCKKCGKQLKE